MTQISSDPNVGQLPAQSLRLSDSVSGALSNRRMMVGVLAMSFASLLLELSLTRLFSVILFYHFAFLAISIALLGLGAGGVFSYVLKRWLSQFELNRIGMLVCA